MCLQLQNLIQIMFKVFFSFFFFDFHVTKTFPTFLCYFHFYLVIIPVEEEMSYWNIYK